MSIIADYPAYTIVASAGEPAFKDGDVFAMAYQSRNHGTLYRFFTLGNVMSYAQKYDECPVKAYEAAVARGHKVWWANMNATSISTMRTAKTTHIALNFGDTLRYAGRTFRLDREGNAGHVKLTVLD